MVHPVGPSFPLPRARDKPRMNRRPRRRGPARILDLDVGKPVDTTARSFGKGVGRDSARSLRGAHFLDGRRTPRPCSGRGRGLVLFSNRRCLRGNPNVLKWPLGRDLTAIDEWRKRSLNKSKIVFSLCDNSIISTDTATNRRLHEISTCPETGMQFRAAPTPRGHEWTEVHTSKRMGSEDTTLENEPISRWKHSRWKH